MSLKLKLVFARAIVCLFLSIGSNVCMEAQAAHFHNAPAFSAQEKNPYAGQHAAIVEGARLYARNCGSCHGIGGRGAGKIPALSHGALQSVPDGEVFWFITTGSVANGMPSWAQSSEQQRWQIVTYVKALKSSTAPRTISLPSGYKAAPTNAAAALEPFSDPRFQHPGTIHKVSVQDLPAPYSTESANNGPQLVIRPPGAWPKATAGFHVQRYATGLDNPRRMRTAPNGDIFLAESNSGIIRVFRGITPEGKAVETHVFAKGLNEPCGIAFYPPGNDPQWIYVGNTDSVVRFPYQNGDLEARGAAEHVADPPHGGGHWTRDKKFTSDGKKMFVSVG